MSQYSKGDLWWRANKVLKAIAIGDPRGAEVVHLCATTAQISEAAATQKIRMLARGGLSGG